MRVINRTAISIVGARPYVEWTERTDADINKGTLTVARSQLFEFQLSAWTEDESLWPADRDLKRFREWFRVDIHNVVVDAGDNDIEGEEL